MAAMRVHTCRACSGGGARHARGHDGWLSSSHSRSSSLQHSRWRSQASSEEKQTMDTNTHINHGYASSSYQRAWAAEPASSFAKAVKTLILTKEEPTGTQVLLRVLVAGVNGGCETLRCRAEHWFERNNANDDGFAVGAEGCAIVEALGPDAAEVPSQAAAYGADVDGTGKLAVGDIVAFVGGAFSEYVTAPSPERLVRIAPAGAVHDVNAGDVAAIHISGAIAVCALYHQADLRHGERVVVTTAAGGTGQFAVQLALMRGCHVVATCGTETKRRALELLCEQYLLPVDCNQHDEEDGFRHVREAKEGGSLRFVNSRSTECRDAIRAALDQAGGDADVIYEGVGGAMRETCLDVLNADGGRLLVIGYISEYPHTTTTTTTTTTNGVPPSEKLFWSASDVTDSRGARVIGNVWGKRVAEGRKLAYDLWRDGKLRVMLDNCGVVDGDIGSRATYAVERMLGGDTCGKCILHVSDM